MVKIILREGNPQDVEKALKRLKRKAQQEGLIIEQRKRQRYKKPNQLRVERKKEQVRNEKRRVRLQEKIFGF